MSITVEATYEGGVLRPLQPLPLKDHQTVRVTVHEEPSLAERTAGIVAWRGNPALLEQFAMDPELDFDEAP